MKRFVIHYFLLHCSAKRMVLAVGVLILLLLFLGIPGRFNPIAQELYDGDKAENITFNSIEPVDDGVPDKYSKGLEYDAKQFYLNGKPLRIIGGSFHYFRTRPEQWKHRLEVMKAAGLNTVTTYIPWNLHERQRGKFDFKAEGYDLFQFIRVVQEVGLYMILRPGPYICAEWEFGGFPSWLLHDPIMKLRTSHYKPYLLHVKAYFTQLLPRIRQYTFRRGGPIIALQVENEFGSYETSPDPVYLEFIVALFKSSGIKELLITSDGSDLIANGTLPNLFPTVNFDKNSRQNLKKLNEFSKEKYPLMVTEFWAGWFDHWYENHHVLTVEKFTMEVNEVLSNNASINFYMFTGGTNFGFWNGANLFKSYKPTVTSYDYDALISESGDIHPTKYQAVRDLLVKHGLTLAADLPPVPVNPPKMAYGKMAIEQTLTFSSLYEIAKEAILTLPDPVFMEFLSTNGNGGQGYGWTLYRTTVTGSSLIIKGAVHDRAQVFVNGILTSTIYNMEHTVHEWTLDLTGDADKKLDILVENMGRVNFKNMVNQRKGFQGQVLVDGNKVENWQHLPIEFSSTFIDDIHDSTEWISSFDNSSKMPTLYKSFLEISDEPKDTFLDMSLWVKGIVIVNKFVLGRYWNTGPQQTLYVPWPLLKKGKNEIVVFELEKPASHIIFIDNSILGNGTVSSH